MDALTGIENRRTFTDAMVEHAEAGSRPAPAVIDLDLFTDVNDQP